MASTRLQRYEVQFQNTEDGLRLITDGNYGFIALRQMEREPTEGGRPPRAYVLSGANRVGGKFPPKPEWQQRLAAIRSAHWSGKGQRWRLNLASEFQSDMDVARRVAYINRCLVPLLQASIRDHRLVMQQRRRRYYDGLALALTVAGGGAPRVADTADDDGDVADGLVTDT